MHVVLVLVVLALAAGFAPTALAAPIPGPACLTPEPLRGGQPKWFPPGTATTAARVRFTSHCAGRRLGGRRCRCPKLLSRPSIAGEPAVGHTLIVDRGRWRRTTGAFRIRWQRRRDSDWVGAGRYGARRTLRERDAGAILRVVVRARGRARWSPPAASKPVGPVRTPAPPGPDRPSDPSPPAVRPSDPSPPPPVRLFDPPQPRTIFSPSSFWNATIPENVVFSEERVKVGEHPDGTAITTPVNPGVAQELAARSVRSDGSSNARVYHHAYTVPLTRVAATTTLQPVRLCRSYPSNCVPSWGESLDRTLRGVAQDGTYLGGGVPVPDDYVPRRDDDASAVFYQPDYVAPNGRRGRLYELWGLEANPDFDPAVPVSPANARWRARWGGRLVGVTGEGAGYWADCWWAGCGHQADTSADPNAWGRPDSQAREHSWGASATSLPLLASEVALDECRSGVIQHAVGLQVPNARKAHWWPAQRTDGTSDTTTLIEGMRLTFAPGARKPANMTALGSSLWDAVERHGFVIDDKSGERLTVRVEPGCDATAWWGGVHEDAQLYNFPWAELRVIEEGTATNPNPTG